MIVKQHFKHFHNAELNQYVLEFREKLHSIITGNQVNLVWILERRELMADHPERKAATIK